MNIVPAKLNQSVKIRENVEKNIEHLSVPERKELWRKLSKVVKSSLFYVHNRLNQFVRLQTDKGTTIFGSIVSASFIAIMKITKEGLFLYSVISRKRFVESESDKCCTLVSETTQRDVELTHVFAGVNKQQGCIVWRVESRHKITNRIIDSWAEMILPFDMSGNLSFRKQS